MSTPKEKLQLRHDGRGLGIETQGWQHALESAKTDDIVKIRHAAIEGSAARRIHVAAISDRVSCHFHVHGNEDYALVSGQGELYWGKVTTTTNGHQVAWEEPLPVTAGDSFIIPEGYAHQLRNTGKEDLIILFACPDSHLDDNLDRFMLTSYDLRS